MSTKNDSDALGPIVALGSAIRLCEETLPPSWGAAHLVPGLEKARGLISPRTASAHAAVRDSVWKTLGETMPEDLDELRDRLELAVCAAFYAVPRIRAAGQDDLIQPRAAA